jgi:hypothetical protein
MLPKINPLDFNQNDVVASDRSVKKKQCWPQHAWETTKQNLSRLRLSERMATLLVTHVWKCILISSVLTIAAASGCILRFRVITDFRLMMTDDYAPSWNETNAIREFANKITDWKLALLHIWTDAGISFIIYLLLHKHR